jgi:hypothetical protein
MGNAVGLFFGVPGWFLGCLLRPFAAGPLTFIPFVGIVLLGAGSAVAIAHREWRLFWFLTSVGLSQVLVAGTGFFRGAWQNNVSSEHLIPLLFFGLQLGLILFFLHRFWFERFAAIAFALFCTTYALFGWFIAAMSLSDTWL